MQLEYRVAVVRIFPLFSHILLTTVLYWTKFDSIQVTLSSPSDKLAYQFADESYTGLISVSLIFLIFQVVCLGLEVRVTLWTILHIFLDICACTFVTWIILDGLSWDTYIYVFVFCR
jgi:Transmembrane protein